MICFSYTVWNIKTPSIQGLQTFLQSTKVIKNSLLIRSVCLLFDETTSFCSGMNYVLLIGLNFAWVNEMFWQVYPSVFALSLLSLLSIQSFYFNQSIDQKVYDSLMIVLLAINKKLKRVSIKIIRKCSLVNYIYTFEALSTSVNSNWVLLE